MSKLQELIQRLCPDGVEYKKLGEVAEVGTGSSDKKDADANGSYPFFVRSKIVERHNCFEYNEEAVIIPGEGGIGEIFHYINGPYALHQRVYRIHFTSTSVNTRFAYYYLFAHFKCFIMKKAVSATVTSIRKPMIETFPLAVPPLEVQEEIVRILDSFSDYAAELQAELQARKEQYEYYRNLLLTFNPAGCAGEADDEQEGCVTTRGGHSYPIQWKTMGEIFEMRNGYTPSKSNNSFWDNGTIPWFRMEDIRENGRILSDAIQHITPEAVKGKGLFEANTFILATTATIGEHALIIADSLANQQFTNLKVRKSLSNSFLTKYLYYYMFIVDEFCKNNTNVSGFASVDMGKLKRMSIPIPPLELQEKIVAILDRFETLVNDLSEGLPAEIAAVKEQYEYYRNRLLTFKEKTA